MCHTEPGIVAARRAGLIRRPHLQQLSDQNVNISLNLQELQRCEATCRVVAVVPAPYWSEPVAEAIVPALGAGVRSVGSSPGSLQEDKREVSL